MSNISTIIFGNGLGMALDSEYFKLETGLMNAWESVPSEEKRIISLSTDNMPSTEDELEKHHLIMTACNTLKDSETESLNWLSSDGEKFPYLYQNFIYEVAKHFFEYDGSLPVKFIGNLVRYIESQDYCHIATTNYDKLLYSALINNVILSGYDGKLIDGIRNSGFSSENLERTYHRFGWYLHLHGSPAFRTDKSNNITKTNINGLPCSVVDNSYIHEHIILANTKQKPDLISKSILLHTYFEYFSYALYESDTIYLIGYNGSDHHINKTIQKIIEMKQESKPIVKIIEWDGSTHDRYYWQNLLYRRNNTSNPPEIKSMQNILAYDFL